MCNCNKDWKFSQFNERNRKYYGIIHLMIKQYTSAQVAEMVGYSRSMVLLICQEKGLPRVGKQYVLGEEEIEIIKNSLGHKPTGRPRKTIHE